jgi:hypothetical protein
LEPVADDARRHGGKLKGIAGKMRASRRDFGLVDKSPVGPVEKSTLEPLHGRPMTCRRSSKPIAPD